MGSAKGVYDLLYTDLVAVCKKNLTKSVFCNKVQKVCNPARIQFVKNIVQQQYGRQFFHLSDQCKLSQFEGQQVCFLLPL